MSKTRCPHRFDRNPDPDQCSVCLRAELKRYKQALMSAGFAISEGWQPFDVEKARGIIETALK